VTRVPKLANIDPDEDGVEVSMTLNLYSVARTFAFIIFVLFALALFWLLVTEWYNANLRQFVIDHFPATIGLPVAGVFAFLVVAIFESTAGTVKFEITAVKFEGAAGPIIMWLFCFLAIAISIKLLWNVNKP